MKNIKFCSICFLIFTILFSCSRYTTLQTYRNDGDNLARFNYLGKNRTGYIKLNSGELIVTRFIQLKHDSLSYISSSDSSEKVVTSEQVNYIFYKERFASGVGGFIFGFLGGALLTRTLTDTEGDMAGISIVLGGLAGSAGGLVLGVFRGSELRYKLKSTKARTIDDTD